MSTITLLLQCDPDTIILDIRGTVIDPVRDYALSPALAATLAGLAQTGRRIIVDTATSIQSLEKLFIDPLLRHGELDSLSTRLALYVDSSTAAYRLDSEGRLCPLDDFEVLTFTEAELICVKACMGAAVERFRLSNVSHKSKRGQVNFYCGGSWKDRRAIADFMNTQFRDNKLDRLTAMVPTAKATIDVAVCEKDRGIHDAKSRWKFRSERSVVIGDSLQEGGSDLKMHLALPGSLGIQVGEEIPDPSILHVPSLPAPAAVLSLLRSLEGSARLDLHN